MPFSSAIASSRCAALVGLALACAAPAAADAPFCALRDPSVQIFELYPSASNYRSLVRSIGESQRDAVAEEVGFTLNPRELGHHTLYVALEGKRPLGLVHVRSELSEWGLIELVWSLDLDLTLRAFRVQRCRGPACAALEGNPALQALLDGRSLAELERWIRGPDAKLPHIDGVAPSMLRTLLRSAAKTISVTSVGWRPELEALRGP